MKEIRDGLFQMINLILESPELFKDNINNDLVNTIRDMQETISNIKSVDIEKLKMLVERIIDYTKDFSITETEWYYNIDSVRKSNYVNNKEITWEEFEVAIREEILYDLIFKGGNGVKNQMETDLCNYESNEKYFFKASKQLEKEIQEVLKDFKIERFNDEVE